MKRLLAIACVLLAMSGQAVASEASSPPRREGPWQPTGSDIPAPSPMFEPCSTETLAWVDQQPAVDVESCDWWFQYESGLESDTSRDYGVLWLQTTATPYRGFCVKRSKAFFGAGSPFEVIGAVRARRIRVSTAVSKEVALTTQAGGSGALPASVSKEFAVRPGRMSIGDIADDGVIRASWRSQRPSSKPITLVLGIEVAWDSDPTKLLTELYEIRVETRTTYERC